MRWLFLVLVLMVSACASVDRDRLTKLTPQSDGHYRVEVFVNPDYNLEGRDAEQQRLDWVAYRVGLAGVCADGYEIIDRTVVNGKTGLFGKTHYVYYMLRCT